MTNIENRCLYCYNTLEKGTIDFHPECCKKFFGFVVPPEIPFTLAGLQEFAVLTLGKSVSVTGVQPKISLEAKPGATKAGRFTIVGMPGNYILKPPVEQYPEMPEIEDLTMHLAELLKIKTAVHSLIRLKSGELAYITKRFDRAKNGKLAVEDMAQLTGTLTENKYRGSMEKIGKIIKQYSNYPAYDLISLYELVLFSFITGNADMHLKNFSLLTNNDGEVMLSPAYDLLSTKLLIPLDNEELALPVNGRKSHLRKSDFIAFSERLEINPVSVQNVHKKFIGKVAVCLEMIEKSFLSANLKNEYKALMANRIAVIAG